MEAMWGRNWAVPMAASKAVDLVEMKGVLSVEKKAASMVVERVVERVVT